MDKEQRRNTRLGAIIAIIAVVGVMCSFLIKLTTRMLSIWQLEGIIYGYMQVLFSCALATGILIFVDIGVYVIWGLQGTFLLPRPAPIVTRSALCHG